MQLMLEYGAGLGIYGYFETLARLVIPGRRWSRTVATASTTATITVRADANTQCSSLRSPLHEVLLHGSSSSGGYFLRIERM